MEDRHQTLLRPGARVPVEAQLARAVPLAGDEVAVARDHGVRAALGRGDEEREVRVWHEADALVLARGLEEVRAARLDLPSTSVMIFHETSRNSAAGRWP